MNLLLRPAGGRKSGASGPVSGAAHRRLSCAAPPSPRPVPGRPRQGEASASRLAFDCAQVTTRNLSTSDQTSSLQRSTRPMTFWTEVTPPLQMSSYQCRPRILEAILVPGLLKWTAARTVQRPREQAVDSEVFAHLTDRGVEQVKRLAHGSAVRVCASSVQYPCFRTIAQRSYRRT